MHLNTHYYPTYDHQTNYSSTAWQPKPVENEEFVYDSVQEEHPGYSRMAAAESSHSENPFPFPLLSAGLAQFSTSDPMNVDEEVRAEDPYDVILVEAAKNVNDFPLLSEAFEQFQQIHGLQEAAKTTTPAPQVQQKSSSSTLEENSTIELEKNSTTEELKLCDKCGLKKNRIRLGPPHLWEGLELNRLGQLCGTCSAEYCKVFKTDRDTAVKEYQPKHEVLQELYGALDTSHLPKLLKTNAQFCQYCGNDKFKKKGNGPSIIYGPFTLHAQVLLCAKDYRDFLIDKKKNENQADLNFQPRYISSDKGIIKKTDGHLVEVLTSKELTCNWCEKTMTTGLSGPPILWKGMQLKTDRQFCYTCWQAYRKVAKKNWDQALKQFNPKSTILAKMYSGMNTSQLPKITKTVTKFCQSCGKSDGVKEFRRGPHLICGSFTLHAQVYLCKTDYQRFDRARASDEPDVNQKFQPQYRTSHEGIIKRNESDPLEIVET